MDLLSRWRKRVPGPAEPPQSPTPSETPQLADVVPLPKPPADARAEPRRSMNDPDEHSPHRAA